MKVGARRLAAEPPVVDNVDGIDDAWWFADPQHRDRKFRGRLDAAGRLWVVQRRVDGTFLRTRTAAKMPRRDADAPLAYLFFASVWSDLPAIEVRRLTRRALRGAAR
jgi:hypothetical protein